MSDIIPISSESKFNTIFFSFYKDNIKQYQVIKNFQNYFYYHPERHLPIVKKSEVVRQTGTKKEGIGFPYTYEDDVNIARKFILDSFQDLNEFPLKKLNIGFIDLENIVEGKISIEGEQPITCLSIYCTLNNVNYTFAFKKGIDKIDKENKIAIFSDEKVMLEKICDFIRNSKFDLLSGWNCSPNFIGDGYDIPYLCNRLEKFDLLQKLSNFGIVERHYRNKNQFIIYGLPIIDYMSVYESINNIMNKTMTTYSLQNVSMEELGEGKVDFDGDLNTLYEKDFDTYIKYNRKDVELIKKLEDKLHFISLIDEMRRISFCNFEDTLSNSIMIDNLLIKTLHKMGYVVKGKTGLSHKESFDGAYVKEPVPNMYKWIIVMDFTSLYPFVTMNCNISPDTKIKKVEENYIPNENELKSAYNVIFDKSHKGIFPFLLEWLFKKRKEYQKMMKEQPDKKDEFNNKQQAFKILLNSFYGFMGFVGGRFYDTDLAASVTGTGQKLIKFVISECEKLGFYCITSDTDSVFICRDDIDSREKCLQMGNDLNKIMNEKLKVFCKQEFNINDSTFDLKYEKSAKRGIFECKKHYALLLVDKEGKEVNELQIKGLQIKKSDSSKYSRDYMSKIYEYMMTSEDLSENLHVIDKMIYDFNNNLKDVAPLEISIPSSVSFKEYKSMPIWIRGAKVWEKYFAKKYKTSFENVQKGNMYFIENTLGDTEYGNKDYVITIPEGIELPKSLIINYSRTKERVVDGLLKGVTNILDNIKIKKYYSEYSNMTKDEIVKKLFEQLQISELNYLDKLSKPLFYKRFKKFIESTFQNKMFEKYREDKQINKEFWELIISDIFKVKLQENKVEITEESFF